MSVAAATEPGGINTVVYEGRRWLAERMRAGPEQRWLYAGGRRRLVATCPRYCWTEHLEGDRVACVSGSDLETGSSSTSTCAPAARAAPADRASPASVHVP